MKNKLEIHFIVNACGDASIELSARKAQRQKPLYWH